MSTQRIAIIGAGSWGTALAKLLGDKGLSVTLWGHQPEEVAAMARARENTPFLPGAKLADSIRFTADLDEAVRGHRLVVMVVPSHVFREVFHSLTSYLDESTYIASASKGIENGTLLTMTQLMADVLGDGAKHHLAVLSGPSFAREVADRLPTAVTVAADTLQVASVFQDTFCTDRFRVYGSTDRIGLELGGALKNIVAIAAGISDGLGYGTNTRAALITRGLAEITRLGVKMGANPLTFAGLGGLGDLVLTCTGDLSRNRSVGLKLGQGMGLAAILEEMHMVAEGVKTTRSAHALAARMQVEMPILEQVYQVLYEDKPSEAAVRDLLTRSQKEELEFHV